MKLIKRKTAEFSFLAFTVFLYLSLNSERPELLTSWIVLGVLFVLLNLIPIQLKNFRMSSPMYFASGFLVIQLMKFFWSMSRLIFFKSEIQSVSYAGVKGFFYWIFIGAFFSAAYYLSDRKKIVTKFVKVLILASFFVSLNQVIPLLKDTYGYDLGKENVFFHPIFYKVVPFSSYIFANWCSMNWAGDFIAFGIFSGLGVIFYNLYRAVNKKESVNWGMIAAVFFITAINTAVLFLLKSRGSLIFFSAAFLIFFVGVLLKWTFRYKVIFTALFVGFFLAFVFWAGNFKGALQEVQTISEERQPGVERSWAVNLEAQKRALRMFRENPLCGIGHGNYEKFSEQFADLGVDNERKNVADFSCMSHYYLMLGEEGAGSFVYFLFLVFFVIWTFWSILTSRSQFKALTGISLLSAVLMVLGHASINDLMDRFGMLTLIFITFGVLAGLFREDFDHGI